ncbi:non-specific lipid transfer protein GPI-anchored 20-like [Diospyros lotus]|uniref:non-specific lipid transfer protein GPI-anchored 20-like n=1 Tax=Diospyros lotus TaxID=55363 RepID=UPI00224EAD38|nr:non-specific lipid transfer protein GPI-anchored 20-like [Diospyros lotus]
MASLVPFLGLVPALALALTALVLPVHAQISTACSASMLNGFTPCLRFITSGSNTTSPTSDCCSAVKTVISNGTDCLCLIATGNVPFQMPINRTLAISLPRACNMSVPVQCKASSAPIPAPGPIALTPALSPEAAPEADTTPALTPADSEVPAASAGSRPVLTPSSARPSRSFSPSLTLALLGAMVLKYYY